jgi:LAGLIDADG endonuclease
VKYQVSCENKANQKLPQVEYKTIFYSLDQIFIEWFVGLTDGEGNFYIKLSRNQVQLMFQIGLHLDDLPLLNYLKAKLACGYITLNTKEN